MMWNMIKMAAALVMVLFSSCMPSPQGEVTEVYVMRHGETTWNRAKKFQGAYAFSELTPFGVKLAEDSAAGMAAAGIAFDRIYTSPLVRARQTAEIVSARCGPPPVDDARIAEMNLGIYQGTSSAPDSRVDDNIRAYFDHPEKYEPRGEGAESFEDVDRRVADFLEHELKPQEGRVRRILCVTHAFLMRALMRHLSGAPVSDFHHGAKAPNCCVHVLLLKNGRFTVKETGKVFYAPELAHKVGAF